MGELGGMGGWRGWPDMLIQWCVKNKEEKKSDQWSCQVMRVGKGGGEAICISWKQLKNKECRRGIYLHLSLTTGHWQASEKCLQA